jgi:hypothetical protein
VIIKQARAPLTCNRGFPKHLPQFSALQSARLLINTTLVGTHFRWNIFSDLKRKMDSLLRFQLVAEFEVFQTLFDGFIQSLTTCKPELAEQGPSL